MNNVETELNKILFKGQLRCPYKDCCKDIGQKSCIGCSNQGLKSYYKRR